MTDSSIMITARRTALVLAWLAWMAAQAAAQIEDDQEDRFRPLEQGFDDLSPQAESHRLQPVDLRTPFGFGRVYEITDAPGMLARRAGSVTAVFSRSEYAGDNTPLIPAGTVFYIGSLPARLGGPGLLSRPVREPRPLSPFAVQERAEYRAGQESQAALDLRVPGDAQTQSPHEVEGTATAFTGEQGRRRRVGEIIRAAAWRIRESEAARAGPSADGSGGAAGGEGEQPEGSS